MSIGELYEIYFLTLGTLDRLLEFWVTASFSVVIASFFLGEKINRYIFILILLGYLLYSVNIGLRYNIAVETLMEIRNQLIAQGATILSDSSVGALNISQGLLFSFGFFATLGYLCYTYYQSRRT